MDKVVVICESLIHWADNYYSDDDRICVHDLKEEIEDLQEQSGDVWCYDVSKMPKKEGVSYLLRFENVDLCGTLYLQCSWFEGHLYPDHLEGLVDFTNRIWLSLIKAWRPLPTIPEVKL